MTNTILLQAQQGGGSMMLIMMGVMFVGFYFLMIRPQMRNKSKKKTFKNPLKWGREW